MPLGTEADLGPGDIVLDGDPAPPSERGTAPPLFSAHVYCGQTVAHLSIAVQPVLLHVTYLHTINTVNYFRFVQTILLTFYGLN